MEDVVDKKDEITDQLKGRVGEIRTFIEDQAKAHPVLFFVGAFAVGVFAAQPRILGFLARTAVGVASLGGPLKSSSVKSILSSGAEALQKGAGSTVAAFEKANNSMMTHH